MSRSRELAAKVIYAAFQILKANGGQMRGSEVVKLIPDKVTFPEWDKEVYESTGYIRWESILHFFSIDCMKAGYLRKNKGIWTLTPEGEEAMKLGAEKMLSAATKAYREWNTQNKKKDPTGESVTEENPEKNQKAIIDQYEEKALEGIREFVARKNPYEFQDLVAALLRAMSYYTPFTASRGKDDGIDIIAYVDPLGMKTPRTKVQVKHRPESAVSVDEVRQLVGILTKQGDVGLFVTSGSFTKDAERFVRTSHVHVELVDFSRFIELWQEHYSKMNDEEKNLLPLHPIFFLGANE